MGNHKGNIYFKLFTYMTLVFFTLLMLKITIPYFSLNDKTAFLRIKQWIIHNETWKFAFYTHVFTSCITLIAGFTQFSEKLLQHKPIIHRYLGWVYIACILLFCGPSGFIMAIYANGGWTSQLAFGLLSFLWMYFTGRSLICVLQKKYDKHQKFIIRSYALTLSALTLRAWKFGFVYLFHPHPMDLYRIVAWLGWVPNLIFAEWYIKNKLKS